MPLDTTGAGLLASIGLNLLAEKLHTSIFHKSPFRAYHLILGSFMAELDNQEKQNERRRVRRRRTLKKGASFLQTSLWSLIAPFAI